MFALFGAGRKFSRKENGKVIRHECPSCGTIGKFHEVVPVEYISFFFIPIIEEEGKTAKPCFECAHCEGHFFFYGIRSTRARATDPFYTYLSKLFQAFQTKYDNYQAKSRKRKEARDIEKELQRMKRKMRKEREAGDRPL